jgi:hypothetical protein
MSDRPGAMTQDQCAVLAERATEQALMAMRADRDAGADLALAAAAWAVVMGDAGDDIRADMDEYELTDDGYQLRQPCTCPPDLLARGGFRSTCPVHG